MSKEEMRAIFTQGQLEAVCKMIADTYTGLTGSEIGQILRSMKISDPTPSLTKWKRLFNALGGHQNEKQSGDVVLTFISKALEPSRYINRHEMYMNLIGQINKVLSFRGLEFQDDGKFHRVKPVRTLSEAEARATRLKEKLEIRNVHPHILEYCKAELLSDNYFHAVLEACKSISAKIRDITGEETDGSKLIDQVFGGSNPTLKINSFDSESKKSEQKGFVNLAKGLFGTFRNPTAHSPKIEWEMTEEDALDLFVLASYIIRRIEGAS